MHMARDVDHHPDRQRAREQQIEDRPVDGEVDSRDVDRDPVVELELLLRLELVVLPGAPEEQQQRDRDREVDPHPDQDLLLGGEAGHQACFSFGSSTLNSSRLPMWTVKRISAKTPAARPASRSERPTSSTASATVQTRASVVAPIQPIAARRSPLASAFADARSAPSSTARWAIQTPASTT